MNSFRRTWLTVDLGRLRKNLTVIRSRLPESCDVYAVLKANAYGQGDVVIGRTLAEFGVRRFCMATVQEAKLLRDTGITGEILILSYVGPQDVADLVKSSLTATVVSPEHARALNDMAAALHVTLPVHIKINTGMNRIGFDCKTDEELRAIADAYSLPSLRFTGIFSHFSSSDDESAGAADYCRLQIARFNRVLDFLKEKGIDVGTRHISNSGGVQKYPEARYDAVRCGALLAGYNTSPDKSAAFPIEPVSEWRAAVTCLRTLEAGDAVSYSRKFIAAAPTRVATVAVGYADGWPRSLSNGGTVLLHGHRVPILGNICMDQMMVDVTDVPDVKVGDAAVLIGRDGDLVQTADDVAAEACTCMHEIMSRIGLRVEREYIPAE